MKKKLIVGFLMIGVFVFFTPLVVLANVSEPIPAAATVTSVEELNVQVKDMNLIDGTSIDFGTISSGQEEWSTTPDNLVEISVNNNAPEWILRTYSDNFDSAPDTTTWGFQYGGLRGELDGARVPMAWMVLPNTTTLPGGPGVGDPAESEENGWTFLKDKHDVDDPSPESEGDESFGTAKEEGYLNIAFGSPSYTRIVRPNAPDGSSEELSSATDPFYLFFEGDFSIAAGTDYTGDITLEMISQ